MIKITSKKGQQDRMLLNEFQRIRITSNIGPGFLCSVVAVEVLQAENVVVGQWWLVMKMDHSSWRVVLIS